MADVEPMGGRRRRRINLWPRRRRGPLRGSAPSRKGDPQAFALELIAGGAVDVATVITHHFDIDHTVDALTLAAREPDSLKAIVRL